MCAHVRKIMYTYVQYVCHNPRKCSGLWASLGYPRISNVIEYWVSKWVYRCINVGFLKKGYPKYRGSLKSSILLGFSLKSTIHFWVPPISPIWDPPRLPSSRLKRSFTKATLGSGWSSAWEIRAQLAQPVMVDEA